MIQNIRFEKKKNTKKKKPVVFKVVKRTPTRQVLINLSHNLEDYLVTDRDLTNVVVTDCDLTSVVVTDRDMRA